MASSHKEFVFRVHGVRDAGADAGAQRVRVAAQRSGGSTHDLRAVDGQDIVLLQIAGGPLLRLHPATAAALLQAAADTRQASTADSGVIEVGGPLSVPASEASRGVFGRVLVELFEIFRPQLARASAEALALKLEAQVSPGVHRLPLQGALPSFKGAAPVAALPASDAPMLVFIHGTFSSTQGTFGKLWDLHPQRVDQLAQGYGGGLWALDHRSVTQSPLQNASLLLQALPVGARLHLVTHSRGGLVAEVLARAMRNDGGAAFDAADLALLAGPERSGQRDELRQLNTLIAAKRPRIERVLRVASPARGTLLASGRLDLYLGVLEWALRSAGVPVLPELVDFATAVAKERTKPQVLPGLEAMIPGQALARILTREDLRLDSQLRVVAGDIQGDSVLSWLKVLATDAFYLTSHDLVVNTDSMYGGQARVERPQFVFERGADVSHFRYFANPSSAQAVVDGLLQDRPAQFQPVGQLSWQGQASDGVRAAREQRPAVVDTGNRPAVLVLPGIMGSHLQVDGQRVWLSPKAVLLGGLDRLRYPTAQVTPEEPMDDYFGDLMEDLSDRHDVIPFAFDWRIPIEESAALLAQRLDAALDARQGRALPVRVLAHSMGGLVMRAVELVAPATWQRFFAQDGARFVMAGTPNRGSYAPMLALSGLHPVVNTVDALDTCTSWRELREMMGGFPGLLQLQMMAGGGEDLTRRATWQQLEAWHRSKPLHPSLVGPDGVGPGKRPWGLPSQAVLDQLTALRGRLDTRLDHYRELGARVRLVAGHAEQTVVDLERTDFGVEFRASSQGDGTVAWDSLRLPGVECWRAEAEHGDLLRTRDAFRAYRELLEVGDTSALPRLDDGSQRSAGAAAGAPPVTTQPWRPLRKPYPPTLAEIRAAALGSGGQLPRTADAAERSGPSLRIEVVNGNLTEVACGLLVGHYRSSALTGAEFTLDQAIDGVLSQALALGHYPQSQGHVEVFANRKARNPFAPGVAVPDAVIVAGLGDENELTASRLVDVVAQAAMAWSLHTQQRGAADVAPVAMAALLLGSGGWRINLAQSASALAQGVCQANRQLDAQKLPVIARLTVVELYADRASVAHGALADLRGQLPIQLLPQVGQGSGGLSRPVSRIYRGTDYDIVRVQRAAADAPELCYLVHSRRARSEERHQRVQPQALKRLVASTETSTRLDAELTHALFNLLLPADLRPQLTAAGSLLFDLDVDAAGLPWEALHDERGTGGEPLAVRVPLLRMLRLSDFRRQPQDNSAARHVLVIGEPRCDHGRYPALPGARREAQAVAACFQQAQHAWWQVGPPLLDASAEAVFKALYAEDWRILHIAGHGDYFDVAGSKAPPRGGVVLDDGVFLGADEIAALGTVPELVFVNCCHLGRLDPSVAGAEPAPSRRGDSRSRFAATLAGQLIAIGVRCVVVAGWAVDDRGAETFAQVLYQELLDRCNFGEAVRRARRRTWEQDPGGSTWAAYQCYGDPTWTLRAATDEAWGASAASASAPPTPTRDDLLVALSEARWDAQYRGGAAASRRNLAARLATLENQAGPRWPGEGAVAEAFGDAWSEQGDLVRAIDWYGRALAAPDGQATLRAADQRDNLRVRLAADRGDVDAIELALHSLQQRAAQAPSAERLTLVGSAYKRLALLAARQPQADRVLVAQHVEAMTQAYALAAAQPGFHAPLQRVIGLLMQHLLAGENPRRDDLRDALLEAHTALQAAQQTEPDFWSRVGGIEWALYRVVAVGELDTMEAAFARELADVRRLDASPRRWASVRDTIDLLARGARLGDSVATPALQRLLDQVKHYCDS